jgi:ribosomal protein L7/L12
MNNIKFAVLISYLTSLRKNDSYDSYQVEDIGNLVNACFEPAKVSATEEEINNLMRLMNGGCLKIEAIKSYRTLTGTGLKEAKDAVEKYWVSKPSPAMDASVKFAS